MLHAFAARVMVAIALGVRSYREQRVLQFDPVKEERLRAAMASGATLPAGETIVRPWGP